jgi:hypothetical protein
MSETMLTERELASRLIGELIPAGSQKALADRYGVSCQYINDVLRSRRFVGTGLAKRMGYERLVLYRKVQP